MQYHHIPAAASPDRLPPINTLMQVAGLHHDDNPHGTYGNRVWLPHAARIVTAHLEHLSAVFGERFVRVDPMMLIYVMLPGDGGIRRHTDDDFGGRDDTVARHSALLTVDGAYQGGQTLFAGDPAPHMGCGDLLVFPHSLEHEGLPVVSGRKIVLKTDLFVRGAL